MKRIAVIGTSGCGKTTSARKIAKTLEIRHIELDQYLWLKDWQKREEGEFRNIVTNLLSDDSWVVDGNYGAYRDLIWSRVTDIIWIDLPFWTIFFRLIRRTWRRYINKEMLFGGCRESLVMTLFTTDSIIYWMLQTYWKHKRDYPRLFAEEQYCDIQVTIINNDRAMTQFIESLNK